MRSGFSHLSNRALYRSYLQRIDPREVLSYYGAENASERVANDGTLEVVHSCLLDNVEPHHKNGDRNPSASMNVDHKLYICRNYWGGNIFNLMLKMEKKESFTELVPLLTPFLTEGFISPENFKKTLERIFNDTDIYQLELPSYSIRAFSSWMVSHPYLREVRGIDVDTSSKLNIGYDGEDNRIVFLHKFDGKLTGYQKRAIPQGLPWPATEPQFPKYKSSLSFPKSSTLYNYDRLKGENTVIVVESPMSVAKAYSFGIENVVATFGSSVSEGQIQLLKPFDNVIVWSDLDDAGASGEKKLVRSLYQSTKVRVVSPEPGKDLADYQSKEVVEEKIDSAIPALFKIASYSQEEKSSVRRVRSY